MRDIAAWAIIILFFGGITIVGLAAVFAGQGGLLLWLFLAIGSILLYFLPALVAEHRHKANQLAILVLNLLLGWTLIGWTIALVWALTQDQPASSMQSPNR